MTETANYDFNTYSTLAGGGVPMTQTYTTAATTSANGVSSSWNLGDTIKGLGSLATTGANIYASIANASKKPGETNITLIDPATGKQAVAGQGGVAVQSSNNNMLLIVGGAVLVAIVGFFAFSRRGKKD